MIIREKELFDEKGIPMGMTYTEEIAFNIPANFDVKYLIEAHPCDQIAMLQDEYWGEILSHVAPLGSAVSRLGFVAQYPQFKDVQFCTYVAPLTAWDGEQYVAIGLTFAQRIPRSSCEVFLRNVEEVRWEDGAMARALTISGWEEWLTYEVGLRKETIWLYIDEYREYLPIEQFSRLVDRTHSAIDREWENIWSGRECPYCHIALGTMWRGIREEYAGRMQDGSLASPQRRVVRYNVPPGGSIGNVSYANDGIEGYYCPRCSYSKYI